MSHGIKMSGGYEHSIPAPYFPRLMGTVVLQFVNITTVHYQICWCYIRSSSSKSLSV